MKKVSNADINILVVDDEEVVLSLVRDALEDDGFTVFTACDGARALELIDENRFDLVITDIRMPGMDGIELVKRIRDIVSGVEVVFTTGYANLNSAKEALRQGASDYILKPFELKEIRAAVNKTVEKIKREAESRESDRQLDRLSDLHRMLFTVGDRRTLVTISLRFAMMHCESNRGAVVYWNSNNADVRMLSIVDDEISEKKLPEHVWFDSVEQLNLSHTEEPVILSRDHNGGFPGSLESAGLAPLLSLDSGASNTMPVLVPVNRGSSIFGFLTLAVDKDSSKLDAAGLKFLTFTAHQLAMSLENLEFLEEAQSAYTRLKELQDETIQLEKMAARGEMSAEIGHELNNFLGVVAGNLSLLDYQLKQQNYNRLEKYVAAMSANMDKIRQFTTNLMDLRAISTKKETVYFEKLITEVVDYLKPQKRFREVDIQLEPINDSLPFEADTVHIQQVLYNLFNNSADAMADSETKVITVTAARNPDGDTFRVTVKDTGAGIAPEHLRKVFHEKFTTKEKGHGFGLVVCKRIIQGHKGSISIDSTPGQGTSISIDFPLNLSTHEIPVPSANPRAQTGSTRET
ncbi:MAG: response regulator [Candidatus Zixiibacteriota bacterium]|nr:MAG: response regulator [candidate division Zixibacteria bacterium]